MTLIEWRGQRNNCFIRFKYDLFVILQKRKCILQYMMKWTYCGMSRYLMTCDYKEIFYFLVVNHFPVIMAL